jgi:O-methyltransferase domain
LLVEFAVPSANQALLGKDADMMMLAFSGGMERTEEEYRALFAQAGFQLSKVTPTMSAVNVIEGTPI